MRNCGLAARLVFAVESLDASKAIRDHVPDRFISHAGPSALLRDPDGHIVEIEVCGETLPNRAIIRSATRSALAMMVGVGFDGTDGKKLVSSHINRRVHALCDGCRAPKSMDRCRSAASTLLPSEPFLCRFSPAMPATIERRTGFA